MSEWASMTVYQTVLNVFSGSHMKYKYIKLVVLVHLVVCTVLTTISNVFIILYTNT